MEKEKLNELLSGIYESLTEEQKEKVKACQTPEELIALAGKEGIELPDEVLDAVAGGFLFNEHGSRGIEVIRDSDGEYLATVDVSKVAPADVWETARQKAISMGQSPERITSWDDLNRLRAAAKSGGC